MKRDLLLQSLELVLRPIARLCLAYSVKLQDVVEVLKIAFVREAEQSLQESAGSPSGSRISAATGVHRKDVVRITQSAPEFKSRGDTVARVMVQWRHDPRFCTKGGRPRVLGALGRNSEFAALVESVNGGNLSAYAVLFEMERMGIVERRGNRVSLLWRDFVVERDQVTGLQMLAEDLGDLITAVNMNLSTQQAQPNLHLKTRFDAILDRAVPEIRAWLLEEGSRFHQKVRSYLAKFDADLNPEIDRGQANSQVALAAFSLSGGSPGLSKISEAE